MHLPVLAYCLRWDVSDRYVQHPFGLNFVLVLVQTIDSLWGLSLEVTDSWNRSPAPRGGCSNGMAKTKDRKMKIPRKEKFMLKLENGGEDRKQMMPQGFSDTDITDHHFCVRELLSPFVKQRQTLFRR